MSLAPISYHDPHDRPEPLNHPDLSIEWLSNGKIIMTRMAIPAQSVYDQWDSWMRAALDRWPPEYPLAFLYDFRSRQFGITLHMGTRLRDINQAYQHLRTYRAIVYANGSLSYALVSGIRLLRVTDTHNREFFTDYDKAFAWLQNQLQTATVPSP